MEFFFVRCFVVCFFLSYFFLIFVKFCIMFSMVLLDFKSIRGVKDFFLMFIGMVMVVIKIKEIYYK